MAIKFDNIELINLQNHAGSNVLTLNGSNTNVTFSGTVTSGPTFINGNTDNSVEFLTVDDADPTLGSQRPHIKFTGAGSQLGKIRVLDNGVGMQFLNSSDDEKLTISDAGNATFSGNIHLDSDSAQLQLGDDNDMQISHNGSDGEINNATGNFTIDSAGDIILDYEGTNSSIELKNAGTTVGKISLASQDLRFISTVSDSDIIFRGNDNGTFFSAFQLDMSDSGKAYFYDDIQVSGGGIQLLGTGRIEGIDTVSAGTDAVNKTYVDDKFISGDGTGKEWIFEVEDESNITGNKWYKVATVNTGNGGLHIRGFISNHVEAFASQKVDLAIAGREGGSSDPIEITGTVDILHNASTGTDKCGIRIIESDITTSAHYHYFDVYIRTTRYQMLRLHLTKTGATTFHTSAGSNPVTTEPAPVTGGTQGVEIDTSTYLEGNYLITDSKPIAAFKTTTDGSLSGTKLHNNDDIFVLMSGGSSGTELKLDDASGQYFFKSGDVVINEGSLSLSADQGNHVVLSESGNGTFTINAPDDINLDAGGGDIVLKDDGTEYGRISMVSSDLKITTSIANRDILMIPNGTGNVGIGTTGPAQKLHVIGNSEITGDIFLGRYIFHNDDTNTWLGFPSADTISFRTNGSDRMYINSSGNVGIGTNSPDHKLEIGLTNTVALANQPAEPLHVSNNGTYVDGRVLISVKHTTINAAAANGAGLKMTAGAVTTGTPSYFDSLIYLESATSGNDTIHSAPKAIKFYVDNHDTAAGAGTNYSQLGDLAMTIAESANVGIATDTPDYKLEVNGTLGVSRLSGIIFAGSAGTGTGNKIYGDLVNNFYISTAAASAPYSSNTRFTILNSNGNVGINTSSPSEKLHVDNGTAYVTPVSYAANQDAYALKVGAYNNASFDMGLKVKSTSGGSPYLSFSTTSADDVLTMWQTKVGIGVANPETKLHIKGSSVTSFTGTGEHQFRIESDTTNNRYTGIGFSQASDRDIAKIAMKRTSAGSHLYFGTSNNYGNGITNEALVIDHSGNVGIGDTTPETALEVAGTSTTENLAFKKPTADNQFRGEIVTFGSQSGIAQGDIVAFNSSGQWVPAQANSGTTSKNLLGVAMGTTAAAGILLRGFVRDSSFGNQTPSKGQHLYLSTSTSGDYQTAVPSTTGHIARIIGYSIDPAVEMIYFCPDNTFVEIA